MKKSLIIGLLAITALVVAAITLQSWTPPPPPANFSNLWVQAFDIDTLTNTEADTLTFEKNFDYPSEITFSLNNTELSGTATAVWVVQQSATNSSTVNWQTTDTLSTVTATSVANVNLTNQPELSTDNKLWGYRVRLIGTNSGTGVHRYNINAIARRLDK